MWRLLQGQTFYISYPHETHSLLQRKIEASMSVDTTGMLKKSKNKITVLVLWIFNSRANEQQGPGCIKGLLIYIIALDRWWSTRGHCSVALGWNTAKHLDFQMEKTWKEKVTEFTTHSRPAS